MSLFSVTDISGINPESNEKTFALSTENFFASTEAILSKNRVAISETIGEIKFNTNKFFINLGRWSAHDLLFYILQTTGPSVVYLTTWAISELAVRLIQSAVDNGLIRKLIVVADRRIEIRQANVIATLRNAAAEIYFVDCHAKLFAIENEYWNVSVLTTANLSNNKRLEAGHIYTDNHVFELIKTTIRRIIDEEKPFEWN